MYNYKEFGVLDNGIFHRNAWFSTTEELSRYIKKTNGFDLYVTVWTYENANPESKFTGPLYFDIDNEDLNISKQHTLSVCEILLSNFFIPYHFLKIRYSSRKGFHVLVDENVFDLPNQVAKDKLYKQIAMNINKHVPSVDMNMYDKRRLFRIINTKNSKSDLYKIPVTHNELKILSIDEIKKLAESPRRIEESGVCYIKKTQTAMLKVWETLVNSQEKRRVSVKPACIKNLERGVTSGERNVGAFILSIYYKNTNKAKNYTNKVIEEWDKKNSPPLGIAEIKKVIESVYANNYQIGCSSPELKKFCVDKENCPLYKG